MNLKDNSLLKEKSFINGTFLSGKDGKSFQVTNPFNQQVIANVSDCGVDETRNAIEAAEVAGQKWKKLSGVQRGNLLRKWFDLQMEHIDELAQILTFEQGKPFDEAKTEIAYGASFVEWFSEEAKRVYGDTLMGPTTESRISVIKQPVGVVAAITPWNFPNAMITRKVAPALAAGCTVVVKAPRLTPLSALALAELSVRAGIPKGVLNVITSSSAAEIGNELCTNSIVKKISFTGSTEVGKKLLKLSASTVKKVSLELGGNAPFIIFEDADLDKAVQGLIDSKFRNAGQTCVCSNRILVHESVHDSFSEKLEKALDLLPCGDGFDPDIKIGPLIEDKALQYVDELVKDAMNDGAKLLRGGKKMDHPVSDLIYEPTLLSEVNQKMRVFREEIFGPIVPLVKFKTDSEALELANETPFGLASYIFTENHNRVIKVSEALEYGMVGINTGKISTTLAPFGGVKESGFGREGSKYGMDDYLQIKYLCIGGL